MNTQDHFPLSSPLYSARLKLRLLEAEDALPMYELLQAAEISHNVLNIPHPYPLEKAQSFIASAQEANLEGRQYSWAMLTQEAEIFVGVITLAITWGHWRGYLGYWVGKAYWSQGYMSEAVARALQFGFQDLELNRIHAECFVENIGSARVMEKAGMQRDGTLREYVFQEASGRFRDLHHYSILKSDYQAPA
jgi:[ribosomal protein S5]-alanine N-acetyltransferase